MRERERDKLTCSVVNPVWNILFRILLSIQKKDTMEGSNSFESSNNLNKKLSFVSNVIPRFYIIIFKLFQHYREYIFCLSFFCLLNQLKFDQ